jgi:glycosyltransferase involved in cell wall biosynthesis
MNNFISVIIPSYNSSKTIIYTLDGLFRQMGECLKEVIVVDSSDDGKIQEIISNNKNKKIKFINSGIRVMPAIGRNIGAAHATGTLLAFIDSDAYPAEDWLMEIARAYEKGRLAGGGGIELPEFQQKSSVAVAQYYLQFNEYMCYGAEREKDFVPACNLFCDKELFNKAGGFPEIRASEDTLFCLRINQINKLWFEPQAKVFHIFREQWRSFLDNQKLLGRYIIIYRRKYYNSVIYKGILPVILLPGFICVKLLRIIFRLLKTEWSQVYRFIKTQPTFLIGLLYWSIGFIKGCFPENNNNDTI